MSTDDAAVSGSTDVTEDVEHHLGGVAAALAGLEAFAPPEEPARFIVDAHHTDPATVKVAIESEGVAGKLILEPAQARALADRLETAALEADRVRDGE